MSKRSTTWKRLFAAMLALALTLAVPVLAGDGPSITIVPNKSTNTSVAGRFKAYQIFAGAAGKFDGDSTGGGTREDWAYGDPNSGRLTIDDWGGGVDADAFVEALIKTTKAPIGDAFAALGNKYAAAENGTKLAYQSPACALDVASILGEKGGDPGFVKAFAALAAKHRAGSGVESGKSEGNWIIGDAAHQLADGYYLIIDTKGGADDDAVSEYILALVGPTTMYMKSDVPAVDKDILGDNGPVKGDAAGVGDAVTFRLTGYLPENYSQFEAYQYIFHDTLSKGLTYTGNLEVYAQKNSVKYAIPARASAESNPRVTVGTYDGKTGTELTVAFSDLKDVTGTKVGGSETVEGHELDSGWTIVVEYTAVVNTNAVIGSAGNPNTVYLEYSNDPNNVDMNGTSQTTEQTAKVYTFGLDMEKRGTGGVGLGGAGFALTTTRNGDTYYGAFTKKDKSTYTLAGWLTQEQLLRALGESDIDDLTNETWQQAPTGDQLNRAGAGDYFKARDNSSYYVCVVTPGVYSVSPDTEGVTPYSVSSDAKGIRTYSVSADADGVVEGAMIVNGLDEGTYTLAEVVVPDGYKVMRDVTFTVTAAIQGNGELSGLTAKQEGTKNASADIGSGNVSAGLIPIVLTNHESNVPTTGGMGTTIFYIGGAGMLLAAAYLAAFSVGKRRKGGKRMRKI